LQPAIKSKLKSFGFIRYLKQFEGTKRMFWDSSRLIKLIGFFCLLLAQPLHATILSSALLNEAQQLAEIEPAQAKQAAKNYLSQR
ncbi:hypothetical protein OFN62_35075, partial [Escherichia coli]|nr:hypothetical protein [Escherichia coli]